MFYRQIIFMLLLALAGTGKVSAYQSSKDDTEKERAKRAADSSPGAAKDEPATRLEKFMARKNVLIMKETYGLGTVPGQQGYEVKVEAIVLSAVGEVAKVYGLSLMRFSGRAGERPNSVEATTFVDFDEIASLQNALEYLAKVAGDSGAEGNAGARPPAEGRGDESGLANALTEFSLLTRGGLKTGLSQIGRQQTGFIQFTTASQDSSVVFGIGALSRFRNLVAQGRSKLLSIGAR
jgi:hypothetical protein